MAMTAFEVTRYADACYVVNHLNQVLAYPDSSSTKANLELARELATKVRDYLSELMEQADKNQPTAGEAKLLAFLQSETLTLEEFTPSPVIT